MAAEPRDGSERNAGEQELEALVVLAQQGDTDAFADLYRLLLPRIVRYLHGVVAARDAEDVAHDAFLYAHEALHEYRPSIAPFEAWLVRIARNRGVDWRRREARIELVAPAQLGALGGATYVERFEEEEAESPITREQLHGRLSLLPKAQREVILLRYVLGCTTEETARIVGRTPVAVRQHHSLALRFLRQDLVGAADDETRRTTLPMRRLAMPGAFAQGGFTLLPAALGRALRL